MYDVLCMWITHKKMFLESILKAEGLTLCLLQVFHPQTLKALKLSQELDKLKELLCAKITKAESREARHGTFVKIQGNRSSHISCCLLLICFN